MTTRIEYGSKDAADAARDRHEEYLCTDDDRRLKTVAYSDADTPDHVLDAERLEAEDSRGEGSDGPGQVPLSDGERDRIDFGKARASVPHAKAVKGIARSEGVEDWVSYYDGTLTVDEHREVMADASRESGKRTDEQESADEKAADAAQTAKGERCDHARGHCEAGDPEACEFLTETCGYDEEEVQQFLDEDHADDGEQTELVTVGGDEYPEMELRPEVAGALRRSWGGYKNAVGDLETAIADARQAVIDARQSWRAINRIREANGQPELHPNRLHTLLDSLDSMPGSVPIVKTLDHFAQEPGGDRDELADSELAEREPTRPDPADRRPDDLRGDDRDDEPAEVIETADTFASEGQAQLSAGVSPEETPGEDRQVTLTGENEDDAVGPLPSAWTREGTTWTAGPYKVAIDRAARNDWVVRLHGPPGTIDVASGLPDAPEAEAVAMEYVDLIDPDEIGFKSTNETVQVAAAEAKKAALDDEGGILNYT
ncbi:hypothetical protein [Halomicrobium mukohataei]|uniref:Uncharacterized protein n=1 Tax=Halomicrobium mukohataei (strain ATCC 700874 / DSM 12286 / JCM 9738 / NCIMB 13541) TaxID=485914 RepID=C7NYG2_HALMD|nr:hypothetical protein [Halomicrobium mukohataei]ACV46623.1 hypothetical protein Hmuk_0489 [Halomicrobium mukohataei DSM 12286]